MFGSCFRTRAVLVTDVYPEKRYDLKKVFSLLCCTFWCFHYIYLYYMHVLRSEFGHVYLVTTLVYLLNLLYVNCPWFGGRTAQQIFYFVHCMCIQFVHLLYGTLCLRFGEGSCTTERSIIIIVIFIIICVRRDQGRHASRGRDVQQSFLPSFLPSWVGWNFVC